ncbi:MAG: metal ABC transporter permease [Clostridiales bacterium]|nr:metal ABC transporter permease [Clostridiales bacterium]
MIQAIFKYTFMQNALLAALLASVVAGVIGTIVMEKKLVSMSGGIAHASFGGIGFGYLLNFEPIWGGLFFAIGSSLLISRITKNGKIKADTLTGILWSFGMALGILFISLTPGYMPDMTSYLFGDILSVSNSSIFYMSIFTIIIVVLFVVYFHSFMMYLFDEDYARSTGMNVTLLEYLVYIMIPLGIIVLIKIVGIILTIALMTIPVSIAKMLFNSLKQVVISSVIISTFLCIVGIAISYYINIPSGACIIIFSTFIYFITWLYTIALKKSRHTHKKHHHSE